MKLFFLLTLLFVIPAWAEERYLSLPELATTQTAIGKAEVEQMLIEWAQKAEGNAEDFRAILKAKIHDRVSPAVMGPNLWKGSNQTIYLCDGHHRASAVYRILFSPWESLPEAVKNLMSKELQSQWKNQEDLKIRVRIDQKFSSRKELLKAFRAENIGQIPNEGELATRMTNLTEDQILRLYQQMAPNLASLKDSPWRSALGNAFNRMDISGENFQNYLEFHLADFLVKKYPSLENYMNNPLEKSFQAKLERILLTDPEVYQELKRLERSNSSNQWEKKWNQLKETLPRNSSCAGRFQLI